MALTFAEMADLFANDQQRIRIHMCIRQQGSIFAADGRDDIAALGRGVVAGHWGDIEALIVAAVTGPNGATIGDDDQALLGAVQEAWPRVASARFTSDGDRRD